MQTTGVNPKTCDTITHFITKHKFEVDYAISTEPITDVDVTQAMKLIHELNALSPTYTGHLVELLFQIVMTDADDIMISGPWTDPALGPICTAIDIELIRKHHFGYIHSKHRDIDTETLVLSGDLSLVGIADRRLDEKNNDADLYTEYTHQESITREDGTTETITCSDDTNYSLKAFLTIEEHYAGAICFDTTVFRDWWSDHKLPYDLLFAIVGRLYRRTIAYVKFETKYAHQIFVLVRHLIHNWESFKAIIDYIESSKIWFTDSALKNKQFNIPIKPFTFGQYHLKGLADAVFGNTVIDIKCVKKLNITDVCRQLHLYAFALSKEQGKVLSTYWLDCINFYTNEIIAFTVDVDIETNVS